MADNNENFTDFMPMSFGESFTKQATTTTVEQVKAIKKLHIPQKKNLFSRYHPRSYQNDFRGRVKSSCPRFQPYKGGSQPSQPFSRPSQNHNTKTINSVCCTFSRHKIDCHHNYVKFKCSTTHGIVTNLHVG